MKLTWLKAKDSLVKVKKQPWCVTRFLKNEVDDNECRRHKQFLRPPCVRVIIEGKYSLILPFYDSTCVPRRQPLKGHLACQKADSSKVSRDEVPHRPRCCCSKSLTSKSLKLNVVLRLQTHGTQRKLSSPRTRWKPSAARTERTPLLMDKRFERIFCRPPFHYLHA